MRQRNHPRAHLDVRQHLSTRDESYPQARSHHVDGVEEPRAVLLGATDRHVAVTPAHPLSGPLRELDCRARRPVSARTTIPIPAPSEEQPVTTRRPRPSPGRSSRPRFQSGVPPTTRRPATHPEGDRAARRSRPVHEFQRRVLIRNRPVPYEAIRFWSLLAVHFDQNHDNR